MSEEREEETESKFYAVRVQAGREKNAAEMLAMRARKRIREDSVDLGLKAIIAPDDLRGYFIIEVEDLTDELRDLVYDLPDARGIVEKPIDFEELDHYFAPKPEAVEISEGDVVEILSGPFKGEKARVVSVDESRGEITVELLEAPVPIPVTVKVDSLRLLREEEEYEE